MWIHRIGIICALAAAPVIMKESWLYLPDVRVEPHERIPGTEY